MKLALLSLALVACTTFDPVPRGTCGNGVLEPGEDCDSSAATCVKCAVTCTTAQDCPTADYACGVDGLCHAPGGALAPPVTAGPFEATELRVTDIDHDGTGDAIGLSKTSIVIRHGDAAGALSNVDSIVTPLQPGSAAFGRLDGDTSSDVVISAPDGLVAYASPYGALSPLAIPSVITSDNNQPLDLRYLFQMSTTVLGAVAVDGNNHVFILAVDFLNQGAPSAIAPCNAAISPTDFSPSMIDVYQVNKDTDASNDFVVSMVVGTGTSARLCVTSIHKASLLAAPQLFDITPFAAPALARRPVLADLDVDSDRCPGLVNTDGAARYWDGAMLNGHCTLKPAAAFSGDPLPACTGTDCPPPGAYVIGRAPLDPPVLGVAWNDALVFTDGLYAYAPIYSNLVRIYHSTRKLAGAASMDLDADGDTDIVLFADQSDDIDVLYRSVTPGGYELLRLDTASEVTSVTLGDFDGNGLGDISYTEQIAGHQRMMVSWGTPDRPLDPVLIGDVANIASIARVEFADTVDILNVAQDISVLQPGVSGKSPTLTIYHGSPQRTMLPYFDPRSNGSTQLRAAAIGQFANGDTYNDLLALAPKAGAPGTMQAFVVAGSKDGLQSQSPDGVDVVGIGDCAAGGTGLCIQDATYLSWPTSGKDVVLAVDRETTPHAAMLDPSGKTTITARALTAFTPPAQSRVGALASADVDGDGNAELVAPFAPRPGTTGKGAMYACKVTAGVPESCEDLLPAITAVEPATKACLDAVPGRVAYRDTTSTASAATQIVVLCADDGSSIYRVSHDDTGYHAEKLAHAALPLTRIQVGDVTGDGVDDVIALAGDVGSQALVVFEQCTSRDATHCQRTSAGAGKP